MVLKVDFWRLIQTLQSVTTPAKPIDIQRCGKSKQTAAALLSNGHHQVEDCPEKIP